MRHVLRFISISVATFIIGCKGSEAPKPAAPAVTVSKPVQAEVMEWDEYSGRLESPNMVNVSARVDGLVVQTSFIEGAMVQQGDLLFTLDDRTYKAEVAKQNASVASAQAQLSKAKAYYNRIDKIRETKAVSADDLDQARAALDEASAVYASAKAAQELAALNLEWTRVTAPITGKVSRKLISEGNLVKGGDSDATLLTTITSIDPLYSYVDVPERAFLKYQSLHKARNSSGEVKETPCKVQLENETNFPRSCSIDFVDNHIDPATGTIKIRGLLQNSDHSLSAGLFARFRVPGSLAYNAILIPDVAVGTDQTSKFLLVVDKDNTVSQRKVTLGAQFGVLRAISEGLSVEDKVVINGLQTAKPNNKVTPTEAPIPPEAIAVASAGVVK